MERLYSGRSLSFSTLGNNLEALSGGKEARTLSFPSAEIESYRSRFYYLIRDIRKWQEGEYALILFSPGRTRASRLAQELRDYGIRGVWMALFHSVSAFCNAGFDLLGTSAAPFVSISSYVGNPVVNLTIMLLIILGGLGFLTWNDIYTWRFRIHRYRLQSKIILTATAFLILLREGVEAILVLVGIIAYLGRAGHEKEISIVYNWAIAGIIASFISAYLFVSVLDNTTTTGSGREIIEGCTALFAVLVLLGTSAWMGGKSNAKAWKSYIDSQVKLTLSTGKSRALGFAVFLAVYREGAEVILFYQALFNNAFGDIDMIWAGFVAACVALALLFFLLQRGALRIPIGPFFKVTSAFMFVLAVTFLGGGLKELQEADVISTSVIESIPVPSIDLLGLYPTYETVVPQILLILAAVAAVSYRKRSAAAEA